MPLPDAATLGTNLATAAGSVDAVGIAKWQAIAAVIHAALLAADVTPLTGVPPMTVAAAPGAVAGFGKIV